MTSPYPPLAEVRKNLKVQWYRCPIEHQKLRELSRRSNLQGWFQTGGHLILFAGTGAVSFVLWSEQMWLGFIGALLVHGTVGSFLAGVAPHELGHGTVFRTRWLNKLFLYLYSLLSWWDPFDYASSHTYHHRYTQYPDGDRENLLPLEPSVGATFLIQMFTINLLTTPGRVFGKGGAISTVFITIKSALGMVGATDVPSREWMQALHTDQPDQARRSMWWSRLQLLFHGTVAGVAIATDLWVLPLLLTLFPFIANWGVYFVGMTQHCGLRDNVPDFRKSVRSFTLNPVASFLYWRMNWHTEHHMYAGVPCYNLKKLYHEIARDMPEPRTLMSAWREMRYTWNRQKTEPTYQFDTPLPDATTQIETGAPDELECSIGELAPVEMK